MEPCESGDGREVRGTVAEDPGVDNVDDEIVLEVDDPLRGVEVVDDVDD